MSDQFPIGAHQQQCPDPSYRDDIPNRTPMAGYFGPPSASTSDIFATVGSGTSSADSNPVSSGVQLSDKTSKTISPQPPQGSLVSDPPVTSKHIRSTSTSYLFQSVGEQTSTSSGGFFDSFSTSQDVCSNTPNNPVPPSDQSFKTLPPSDQLFPSDQPSPPSDKSFPLDQPLLPCPSDKLFPSDQPFETLPSHTDRSFPSDQSFRASNQPLTPSNQIDTISHGNVVPPPHAGGPHQSNITTSSQSTASLFGRATHHDNFFSFQPQSEESHVPPLNHVPVSTHGAPSTSLISTLPTEQFSSYQWQAQTSVGNDCTLSPGPKSLPVESSHLPTNNRDCVSGLGNSSSVFSYDGVMQCKTGESSQSLSSLDKVTHNRQIHSNAGSNLSSPLSRPSSTADSHIRLAGYGEVFPPDFKQKTNADPDFSGVYSRQTHGGPLTNLDSDRDAGGSWEMTNNYTHPNSAPDRSNSIGMGVVNPTEMTPMNMPNPAGVSEMGVANPTGATRGISVVDVANPPEENKMGTADPTDTTASSSSSLNHSLCSLLDSQDDFISRSSPVRLLAPTPLIHGIYPPPPPPPPPASSLSLMDKVQLESRSPFSLLPPVPLKQVEGSSVIANPFGGICSSGSGSDVATTASATQEPLVMLPGNKGSEHCHFQSVGQVKLLDESSGETVVGAAGRNDCTFSVSPQVLPVSVDKGMEGESNTLTDKGSSEESLNSWEMVESAGDQGREGRGVDSSSYSPQLVARQDSGVTSDSQQEVLSHAQSQQISESLLASSIFEDSVLMNQGLRTSALPVNQEAANLPSYVYQGAATSCDPMYQGAVKPPTSCDPVNEGVVNTPVSMSDPRNPLNSLPKQSISYAASTWPSSVITTPEGSDVSGQSLPVSGPPRQSPSSSVAPIQTDPSAYPEHPPPIITTATTASFNPTSSAHHLIATRPDNPSHLHSLSNASSLPPGAYSAPSIAVPANLHPSPEQTSDAYSPGYTSTSVPPGNTSVPPGNTSVLQGNTSVPPGTTSVPPGSTSVPLPAEYFTRSTQSPVILPRTETALDPPSSVLGVHALANTSNISNTTSPPAIMTSIHHHVSTIPPSLQNPVEVGPEPVPYLTGGQVPEPVPGKGPEPVVYQTSQVSPGPEPVVYQASQVSSGPESLVYQQVPSGPEPVVYQRTQFPPDRELSTAQLTGARHSATAQVCGDEQPSLRGEVDANRARLDLAVADKNAPLLSSSLSPSRESVQPQALIHSVATPQEQFQASNIVSGGPTSMDNPPLLTSAINSKIPNIADSANHEVAYAVPFLPEIPNAISIHQDNPSLIMDSKAAPLQVAETPIQSSPLFPEPTPPPPPPNAATATTSELTTGKEKLTTAPSGSAFTTVKSSADGPHQPSPGPSQQSVEAAESVVKTDSESLNSESKPLYSDEASRPEGADDDHHHHYPYPSDGYDPPYSRDPYYRDSGQRPDYPDPMDPYHSRPHSRAQYGYPDQHNTPRPDYRDRHGYPPPPPPHPHYHHPPPPPPPGRGGYDPYSHRYPPYSDPYHHPHRDPYPYDPYRYNRDVRSGPYYHGYPQDPRRDYPPQGGYPQPYNQAPHMGERDHYAYHSSAYSSESDRYQAQDLSYNQENEIRTQGAPVPEDPSIIYGGGEERNFEISRVGFDSPDNRIPSHPGMPPMDSTYIDHPNLPPPPSERPMHYPPQDLGRGYMPEEPGYYQDGHYGDDYPIDPSGGYDEMSGQAEPLPQWDPEPDTPITPPRGTPEIYSCPHVRVFFGFGGQIVTVLPNNVYASEPALVEISSLKDLLLLEDTESKAFVDSVQDSPGPFLPGQTPKSLVVNFASKRARQCRAAREELTTSEVSVLPGSATAEELCTDEILMWDFLVLLCQQNGVVVPSDIADLLMSDCPLSIKSSSHIDAQSQQDSMDSLRQLLFSGRKKDALDFACTNSLWGHALMLASRMDEQSRTYVVNRFTASLMTTDPLNTFYTLLLGRSPSCVKPEGLSRAGDWRPHLSMILANKTTKLDNASILSLGQSLMTKKRLHASHICYYLSDVHFGSYGDTGTRYSLLGVDHTEMKAGTYPQPQDLYMMEVFEYAMSLTKHDFALPAFQVFKLLYVFKLVEYGFLKMALKYCEQISSTVVKGVHKYVPTFLISLAEIAVRLHFFIADYGIVESELPSWLAQLQQSTKDILSTDYTPNLLSPSPAFSSVSQTYSSSGMGVHSQPVIGIQQDATHLAVPQMPVMSGMKDDRASLSKDNNVRDEGVLFSTESYPNLAQDSDILTGVMSDTDFAASSQQLQQQYGVNSDNQVPMFGSNSQVEARANVQYGTPGNTLQTDSQAISSEGPGVHQAEQQFQPYNDNPASQVPMFNPAQNFPSDGSSNLVNYPPLSQAMPSEHQPPFSQALPSEHQPPLSQAMPSEHQPPFSQALPSEHQPPLSQAMPSEHQPPFSQVLPSEHQPPLSQAMPSEHQPPLSQAMPSEHLLIGSTQGNYSPFTHAEHQQVNSTVASAQDGGMYGIRGAGGGGGGYYGGQGNSGISGPPPQDNLASSFTATTQQDKKQGEAETRSGDARVTEGDQKKNKDGDSKKEVKNAKTGGGWSMGGIISYIIPKKKNQVHLPEDNSPSIVWDEENNKWFNKDGDEEEEQDLAPPPTDAELKRPVVLPASQGENQTDGRANAGTLPPESKGEGVNSEGVSNLYSRQRLKKKGARSKYIDVLNPGSVSSQSSGGALPPPGPPLLPPMGGLGGGMPQANFFVPESTGDAQSNYENLITGTSHSNENQSDSGAGKDAGGNPLPNNQERSQASVPTEQPPNVAGSYPQANTVVSQPSQVFGDVQQDPQQYQGYSTQGQDQGGLPQQQDPQQYQGYSKQGHAQGGLPQQQDPQRYSVQGQAQGGLPQQQDPQGYSTQGQAQGGLPQQQDPQGYSTQGQAQGGLPQQQDPQGYSTQGQAQGGLPQQQDPQGYSTQGQHQGGLPQQQDPQQYQGYSTLGQAQGNVQQQQDTQQYQQVQGGVQQQQQYQDYSGQGQAQGNVPQQQDTQQYRTQGNTQPDPRQYPTHSQVQDQRLASSSQHNVTSQQHRPGTAVMGRQFEQSDGGASGISQQASNLSLDQNSNGEDTKTDATHQVPVQFFNPGAFAQVGGYPGSSESQEDTLSTVSLMSESSQEVSRYMDKKGTASAGYNRLKHGIRGTKGYPAMTGGQGVADQHRPHPAPGQVQSGGVRNSSQYRQ